MNKTLKIILLAIITLVYTVVSWKLLSPPLTLAHPLIWGWVASIFIILGIGLRFTANKYFGNYFESYLCLGIAAIIVVLFGVAKIISLPVFNKDAYTYMYSIIDKSIEEYDVGEEDFSWMTEQAARRLAQEDLKDKLTIVDNFELSTGVLQIINEKPAYVFSIDAKNGTDDSPGFMVVDMKAGKAKFIETGAPMSFTPSKSGAQSVKSQIRKEFLSALVGESHLEINENGEPFWITYGNGSAASIMGKLKTKYIFTTDPFTGTVLRYQLSEAPEWIDQRQPAEEIIAFYNAMTELNKLPYRMEQYYHLIPRDGSVVALVNIVLNEDQNAGAAIVNVATGEIVQAPIVTAGTALAQSRLQAWANTSKLHGWDAPALYAEGENACFVSPMYDDNGDLSHYLFIDGAKADYYTSGGTWEKAISNWKEKRAEQPPEPEQEQDKPISDNPETPNNLEDPKPPVTPDDPEDAKPPVTPAPMTGEEGVDYMLMSGLVESYTEGNGTFSVKFKAWTDTTFYFDANAITAEALEVAKTSGMTFQYMPEYEGKSEVMGCIPVDITLATDQ